MITALLAFGFLGAALSQTQTPTPTCTPMVYFLDANGDGLIDINGSAWYGWYDVDNPSGDGDFENIGYLNGRYWYSLSSELSFCNYPLDVICVTADAAEIPWYMTGLTIKYNKNWGCECINSQNGGGCIDFKVKYLCPSAASEGYYGCNPPTGYIPASAGLESFSATPSVSSSQTPSKTSSGTPSKTSSASLAPSGTSSGTPSVSPSLAPSVSSSTTSSITSSGTPSGTPSVSASLAPSVTSSITSSETPSGTPSVSPSLAPSVSSSQTPSVSPTNTPSGTPTISHSLAPLIEVLNANTNTNNISPELAAPLSLSLLALLALILFGAFLYRRKKNKNKEAAKPKPPTEILHHNPSILPSNDPFRQSVVKQSFAPINNPFLMHKIAFSQVQIK